MPRLISLRHQKLKPWYYFFLMIRRPPKFTLFPYTFLFFFFFNDTATTEIYTLSLHDALPISELQQWSQVAGLLQETNGVFQRAVQRDAGSELVVRGQLLLAQALFAQRSEEHTSELQSHSDLVCRLLLEIGRAHV